MTHCLESELRARVRLMREEQKRLGISLPPSIAAVTDLYPVLSCIPSTTPSAGAVAMNIYRGFNYEKLSDGSGWVWYDEDGDTHGPFGTDDDVMNDIDAYKKAQLGA